MISENILQGLNLLGLALTTYSVFVFSKEKGPKHLAWISGIAGIVFVVLAVLKLFF